MDEFEHNVIFCSTDARKVLNKLPELQKNVFILERALFKARPNNIIGEYKRGSSLEKILALSKNGYYKFDRKLDQIDFDKTLFHYFSVMTKFVKADVKYAELLALNEISSFRLSDVEEFYVKLKHNSLFYLRGALRQNKEDLESEKRIYTRIDKPIMNNKRGGKIKINLTEKKTKIRI